MAVAKSSPNYVLTGPKISNPFEGLTLGEWFFKHGKKFTDRMFHIDCTTNQCETYGGMLLRTTRLAMQMLLWGVQPSDIVVLVSNHSLEMYIVAIATFYTGARFTAMNPNAPPETTTLLTKLAPKVIFLNQVFLGKVTAIKSSTHFRCRLVVFENTDTYDQFSKAIEPKENEENFEPVKVNCQDICLIVFSSGTTGPAKLVQHSHSEIFIMINRFHNSGTNLAKTFSLGAIYWSSTMQTFFNSFQVGGCRVFTQNFDTKFVSQSFEKYKITSAMLSPTFAYYFALFNEEHKNNLQFLQHICLSGSKVRVKQINQIYKAFPQAIVMLFYGCTEVGTMTFFNLNTDIDLIRRKPTSVGKIAGNIEAKVIQVDTGALCGPNQYGELAIKSPSLLNAYYFSNDKIIDTDGFFRVGDIVYYDEDKCFYVVDRTSNCFRNNRTFVIPAIIEDLLCQHEAVSEAVVFGTPNVINRDLGEEPTAYVVLRVNSKVSESDLHAYVETKLQQHEQLTGGIFFCNELKRSAVGKTLRFEMRAQHLKKLKSAQKM